MGWLEDLGIIPAEGTPGRGIFDAATGALDSTFNAARNLDLSVPADIIGDKLFPNSRASNALSNVGDLIQMIQGTPVNLAGRAGEALMSDIRQTPEDWNRAEIWLDAQRDRGNQWGWNSLQSMADYLFSDTTPAPLSSSGGVLTAGAPGDYRAPRTSLTGQTKQLLDMMHAIAAEGRTAREQQEGVRRAVDPNAPLTDAERARNARMNPRVTDASQPGAVQRMMNDPNNTGRQTQQIMNGSRGQTPMGEVQMSQPTQPVGLTPDGLTNTNQLAQAMQSQQHSSVPPMMTRTGYVAQANRQPVVDPYTAQAGRDIWSGVGNQVQSQAQADALNAQLTGGNAVPVALTQPGQAGGTIVPPGFNNSVAPGQDYPEMLDIGGMSTEEKNSIAAEIRAAWEPTLRSEGVTEEELNETTIDDWLMMYNQRAMTMMSLAAGAQDDPQNNTTIPDPSPGPEGETPDERAARLARERVMYGR